MRIAVEAGVPGAQEAIAKCLDSVDRGYFRAALLHRHEWMRKHAPESDMVLQAEKADGEP